VFDNVGVVETVDLLFNDGCLFQMLRPALGRARQSDGPGNAGRGDKLGPGGRHRGPGR